MGRALRWLGDVTNTASVINTCCALACAAVICGAWFLVVLFIALV